MKITWDEQDRRLVDGKLGPEYDEWVTIYWSTDDGALFTREEIDDPGDPPYYIAYEVKNPVTLSVKELARGSNSIIDVLLRTAQARLPGTKESRDE